MIWNGPYGYLSHHLLSSLSWSQPQGHGYNGKDHRAGAIHVSLAQEVIEIKKG